MIEKNTWHKLKSNDVNTDGYSLKGILRTKYENIVKIFGEPEANLYDNRTQVIWFIKINDSIFTINDYKAEVTYSYITRWSIGGNREIKLKLHLLEDVISQNLNTSEYTFEKPCLECEKYNCTCL